MEHAAPVAQHAMRDHRDEVAGREPAEHRAAQRDLPAVLEHAHLARVLGLVRRRGLLERERGGLVDGPLAGLHHPVREGEVVAPLRVDLDVALATQRVDRAVPARDRAEPRLLLPQPELVAPVQPLAVRPGGVLQAQAAADVGDLGVGEAGDELPERVGRPARVRVGEGDDLALGLAHGAILGGDLAAARAVEQPDARLAGGDGLDELVRAVARGVGGDDQLELLRRIVEREQVLEPPLDHALLVVGGDDHGDRRLARGVLRHTALAHPGKRAGRERIADVRPGERAERAPEERLRQRHRASVLLASRYARARCPPARSACCG